MKKLSTGVLAAALTVMMALPLATVIPASASPLDSPDEIAETLERAHQAGSPNLSGKERDLLASSTPKVVTMDAETGVVLSVKEERVVRGPSAPKAVVPGGVCAGSPAPACFYSDPASTHVQFTGLGIDYGTWLVRSGYGSGPYSADACWITHDLLTSACSTVSVGPNSKVFFSLIVIGRAHIKF